MFKFKLLLFCNKFSPLIVYFKIGLNSGSNVSLSKKFTLTNDFLKLITNNEIFTFNVGINKSLNIESLLKTLKVNVGEIRHRTRY